MVMWKLVKSQCTILMKKKEFTFTFILILGFIIANHGYNLYTYYGTEKAEMLTFPEISLLGANNTFGYFFLKIYPFILVLPAGLSIAQERLSSIDLLYVYRIGRKKYYFSKYVAVFLTNFICFLVPFLLELLFNVAAFPLDVHGNAFGDAIYGEGYSRICNYTLFSIYYNWPVLYALIMSVYFALLSAVFVMLPSAISCLYYKYKAYLLLPVYLLIYLLNALGVWGISSSNGRKVHFSAMVSWCDYVVHTEQFIRLFVVCMAIILISMGIYMHSARKDTL